MHGFLNIDKPPGLTSHDVVAGVRRVVGRKRKVGHAGTLDPAATGVLPLAIGQATRLIEYLTDARKGYAAVVGLGMTTTTDDAEGEPVEQRNVPALDPATLEAALSKFRGTIQQVPPMYSALHHAGQRLYELARAGKTVERTPRAVTIDRLELLRGIQPGTPDTIVPTINLAVECSKGTYIRALARDLGAVLGCGAHLVSLVRTFVGPFSLEQAIPLTKLLEDTPRVEELLLPPATAIADWPMITLTPQQCQRIRQGMTLRLSGVHAERIRAHAPDGTLLAVMHYTGEEWQPDKVLG